MGPKVTYVHEGIGGILWWIRWFMGLFTKVTRVWGLCEPKSEHSHYFEGKWWSFVKPYLVVLVPFILKMQHDVAYLLLTNKITLYRVLAVTPIQLLRYEDVCGIRQNSEIVFLWFGWTHPLILLHCHIPVIVIWFIWDPSGHYWYSISCFVNLSLIQS